MKLYGAERGVNPRRVRIFLAEKGVADIEHVNLDLRAGDNLSDEFLQKNPWRTVPVLELDDGSFISESVAICRYFEALYPEPNLFGTTPYEIADIETWSRRVEFDYQVPTSQCFRNVTRIFEGREECSEEWGEISRRRMLEGLLRMERRLEESTFVAGERFTLADIMLTVVLDQALNAIKQPLDEEHYGSLLSWYDEIKARPSYRA